MKKLIFICTLLILTIVIVIPVAANDASMGRNGETVYPLEETDVRMVAEDIYVKYIAETGSGHVTCEFVFENSGEAKSVLMGFPAEEKIWSESLTTVERVRLRNFTANLNGIPIDVNEIEGEVTGEFEKYTSWYVFEVPFNAGESLTMTHEYDVSFTAYSTGQIQLSYILITGATWGGEIGYTKVTFDLSEINPWGINLYDADLLSDFRYENGLLIFEKYDYIPDFNLEVMVNAYSAKIYDGKTPLSEEELSIKNFYENAPFQTKEELIQSYNELLTQEKFVETIYMNTVLGIAEEAFTPVVVGISFREPRVFLVHINDINFDLDNTAELILKDTDGNVLFVGELEKLHIFGDYGTIIFKDVVWDEKGQEAISNKTVNYYEVIIGDSKGNKTITTYSQDDFNDGSTMVLEDEPDEETGGAIENPKTNASENAFYIGLIFLFIAIGFSLLKKVNNDVYIQH